MCNAFSCTVFLVIVSLLIFQADLPHSGPNLPNAFLLRSAGPDTEKEGMFYKRKFLWTGLAHFLAFKAERKF